MTENERFVTMEQMERERDDREGGLDRVLRLLSLHDLRCPPAEWVCQVADWLRTGDVARPAHVAGAGWRVGHHDGRRRRRWRYRLLPAG